MIEETKKKKPKNKKIILIFSVLFIVSIIIVAVINTNKNKESEFDENIKLDDSGKVILTINNDYIDSYEEITGLNQEEVSEEQYKQTLKENEIETTQLGLPANTEELLNTIYSYSSNNDFATALKQTKYYTDNFPDKKESLDILLGDLNILTLIQEKVNSVEIEHLLKQVKDPELFLYSFLYADLDYQEENIKIKESVVIPEHGQVLLKEKIQSIDLPYFEKYLDSRDMEDKEIWKLKIPTNKYTPDVIYYIIHNRETLTNTIYYSEFAEEFPDKFTTRYIHLY